MRSFIFLWVVLGVGSSFLLVPFQQIESVLEVSRLLFVVNALFNPAYACKMKFFVQLTKIVPIVKLILLRKFVGTCMYLLILVHQIVLKAILQLNRNKM